MDQDLLFHIVWADLPHFDSYPPQSGQSGLIDLANAFFEHDGRDRHKNVFQGERAIINLASRGQQMAVPKITLSLSIYIHLPV